VRQSHRCLSNFMRFHENRSCVIREITTIVTYEQNKQTSIQTGPITIPPGGDNERNAVTELLRQFRLSIGFHVMSSHLSLTGEFSSSFTAHVLTCHAASSWARDVTVPLLPHNISMTVTQTIGVGGRGQGVHVPPPLQKKIGKILYRAVIMLNLDIFGVIHIRAFLK